jgi:hypothetical protein
MKSSIARLAAILVLLVVVAYFLMERPGERSSGVGEGDLLFELDSASIDRIEVKSPSGLVVLEKRGAEWFLTSPLTYRADQSNAVSTLSMVKGMKAKAAVSSNPAKRSLFQVDSSGTLLILSAQGKPAASVIIGKMGGTFTETYVRKPDAEEVLLADGSFSFVGTRTVKEWRDRTIAEVARENIKEISYRYGDTTFTVRFADSLWRIGNDEADQGAVNSLLSTLSSLRADDFVDGPLPGTPKVSAQVSFAGIDVQFSFQKTSGKFLVQASTGSQWFELERWRAEQVLKRKNELLRSRE